MTPALYDVSEIPDYEADAVKMLKDLEAQDEDITDVGMLPDSKAALSNG